MSRTEGPSLFQASKENIKMVSRSIHQEMEGNYPLIAVPIIVGFGVVFGVGAFVVDLTRLISRPYRRVRATE